ncbi:DUF1932 domain-containing protein [Pseudoprimorskyibacter insulae]|uniref:3-hydroxyisobutyrate dehydrogenase n=1 Tax=Pseudoprimorskyibacter insulae TaxID=1695997 RepID=A0A2R8AUM2_9RHOB|nr:DUF1932 domain-containing protein [Pseudoprimorskyibacter insulae]SPF79569.1 hypothetical protein PRI8871_01365 [Pseudoprimorskyibacter insulae]
MGLSPPQPLGICNHQGGRPLSRNALDIGFIGFGEAGQAFLSGLREENAGLTVGAYDIKTDDDATKAAKLADYAGHDVQALTCAAEAASAQIVFCTVTADQAELAAQAAAASVLNGGLFLDCNSCAPGAKRRSATVIEAAGGRYVDAAVMAPVHPALHKTPFLLSGPHADVAAETLTALGMVTTIADDQIGTASTRKMLRSVIMKGLEALVLESVLAARKAGVEDDVLASLDATYPGFDWPAKAAYMMERVTTHGKRRAAEMREVARTVEDLGFDPRMSRAIVDWQHQIGMLGLPPGDNNHHARADAILKALGQLD